VDSQKDSSIDLDSPDEALGPKERILEASLELFVKQGYFNTNIPDISRLSKCSVGSIYHHFLNKQEIASKLYQDGMEQFRTVLGSAIMDDSDLKGIIKKLVVAFLDFSTDHGMLARYLWLARHNEFLGSRVSKPTVVGFDLLGRRLTKAIKNGIRNGEIPRHRADIIWSVIFGIPLSYVTDWLDGYTSKTPREVAEELSNACWGALITH
jgi:TetR/AcrR family transcriptional regulator, repressor of fatR-cypB operon